MKTIWEILGIEATDDKRKIKKAYARKVQEYHPEDYPEEYKTIQEAYETAMQYTKFKELYDDDMADHNDTFSDNGKMVYTSAEFLNQREYQEERIYDQMVKSGAFHNVDAATNEECKIKDIDTSDIENETNTAGTMEEITHSESIEKSADQTVTVEEMKIEKDHNTMDNDIRHFDLKKQDRLYKEFADVLRNSTTFESVEAFLKNEELLEQMQDEPFFNRICFLIAQYLPQFNKKMLWFLSDRFTEFENIYHFDHPKYSLEYLIAVMNEEEAAPGSRIRPKHVAIICIVLFIIGAIGVINSDHDKNDNEELEGKGYDDPYFDEQMLQNLSIMKTEVLIELNLENSHEGEVFTCQVDEYFLEEGDAEFTCTSEDEEYYETGEVWYDFENNEIKFDFY